MNLTYQERQELNELSKKAFGTSSKWKKLVDNGFPEVFEREREVMVPTRTGLQKKTFTDRKSVVRRYSVEEVKALMLSIVNKPSAADISQPAIPSINFPMMDVPVGATVQLSDGSTATVTAGS